MADKRNDSPLDVLIQYQEFAANLTTTLNFLSNQWVTSNEALQNLLKNHYGRIVQINDVIFVTKQSSADQEIVKLLNYDIGVHSLCPKDDKKAIDIINRINGNISGTNHAFLLLFETKKDTLFIISRKEDTPFFAHEKQICQSFFDIINLHLESEKKTREITELKNSIDNFYHLSAHTFEKCYNTPVRNMCYLLRQFIHPYNNRARALTFAIQDYIDLWANHFSATTYFGQDSHNKGWIECFPIKDFFDDLINFSQHALSQRMNDLYDDCYVNHEAGKPQIEPDDLKEKSNELHKIWNKEPGFLTDFRIESNFKDNEYLIFGIRPFFRVAMINMLDNAIEALDLHTIHKETSLREVPQDQKTLPIKITLSQSSDETVIVIENHGKMPQKNIIDQIKEIFSKASKRQLRLRSKIETSKSGIGSGRGLVQAAHYFSMIRNKESQECGKMEIISDHDKSMMRFTIRLPFGETLCNKYDNQEREEKATLSFPDVEFLWEKENNTND